MILLTLPAGNEVLRLPCVVNVKDMSDEQVERLFDLAEQALGARCFRDRSLALEVLAEHRADAADPRNFLPGPFLQIFIRERVREIGYGSVDRSRGGYTHYTAEKLEALLAPQTPEAAHKALRVALFWQARKEAAASPSP